jgi:hypothetical protein
MGNKASTIFHKVMGTAGAVAQGVGRTALGALEGAGAGSIAGPEGALGGGLIGGLTSGISNLEDTIKKGKAIWDGSATPSTADSINSVINGGQQFASAVTQGINMLPQQTQAKVRAKVQAASEGRIGKGIAATGNFLKPAISGALRTAYAGRVLPSEAEKIFSPIRNAAQSGLSPTEVNALNDQREVAYLDKLQNPTPQPTAMEVTA